MIMIGVRFESEAASRRRDAHKTKTKKKQKKSDWNRFTEPANRVGTGGVRIPPRRNDIQLEMMESKE